MRRARVDDGSTPRAPDRRVELRRSFDDESSLRGIDLESWNRRNVADERPSFGNDDCVLGRQRKAVPLDLDLPARLETIRAKVDEQPIDTKRLVVHRRVELDNGTVVQRDVVDHELSRINSNRSDELLIAKTALVPSETTAQRCADRQRRVEAIGVDDHPH